MRRVLPFAALALALGSTTPVVAQVQGVVFAAYYECDPTMESVLDDLVMERFAPIYEQLIEAGDIMNWGWNAHSMGGPWRRLGFFIAPDRATGLEARATILSELQAQQGGAVQMFNGICPSHEDYMWNITQASQAADPAAAAPASLSTYYSCNQGAEAQADDIVSEAIAPILEELVQEGQLIGWSWLSHSSGGWFRRAVVLAGASHAAILDARDALQERVGNDEAMSNFGSICSSHVDYHWNAVSN